MSAEVNMSDGITDGYRMGEEARDYTGFLKTVAEYLKSPSREGLRKCRKARFGFGRYAGRWVGGDWRVVSKIRRLRKQNEEEWAALLASCITEEVGRVFSELKALSPFRCCAVAFTEYELGGLNIRGDISQVLKKGRTFERGGERGSLLIVPSSPST